MKILFGTQNPKKQQEIQQILTSVELVFPDQISSVANLDPAETGSTFEENASIKARAFANKSGLISVADDSGLVVTALKGFPGVKSKRFIAGSDQLRNEKILEMLRDQTDRSAKFVTVLAISNPNSHQTDFVAGEVAGQIAFEEIGQNGFGYDPIFIPDNYETSFAALGQSVKNKISHRARALQKLNTYFKEQGFYE